MFVRVHSGLVELYQNTFQIGTWHFGALDFNRLFAGIILEFLRQMRSKSLWAFID